VHSEWFRVLKTALAGSVTRDVRAVMDSAARLVVPVTTGRRLAVVSLDGDTGQTTLCVLIARVLASRRSDRVLLIDADPRLGSCGLLGLRSVHSVRGLAAHTAAYQDFAALSADLGRSPSGLWVLTGIPAPGVAPLSAAEYRAAAVLRRFFSVTVVGCGSAFAPPTSAVLTESHAVVVVAAATTDGIREVKKKLRGLRPAAGADRYPHVMVAATARSPLDPPPGFSQVVRELPPDVPVVLIPYDRHLAAAGSAEGRPEVGVATRTAVIELAALALAKANGT
jgi:MinD-like ATPase involved in chromosome partitioning or flagellar assembly